MINNSSSKVKYNIFDINDIRAENEFGGFRIRIECKLENIKEIIPLDISAGDIITYRPVEYMYKPLFHDEKINIIAYNLETIIAEKLETINRLGFTSSRMKDYYDVYIRNKLKFEEINIVELKEACSNTFTERNTNLNNDDFIQLILLLKEDITFQDRWNSFINKNNYLGLISFDDVIKEIEKLIKYLK